MPTAYISKLNRLSPALQAQLSDDKFLAKIDGLEEQYGIKAVLLLLDLLLNELDYSSLDDKLIADYGFNIFLAKEIKGRFGELIEELGSAMSGAESTPKPAEIKIEPIKAVKKIKAQPVDFSTSSFSDSDEAEVKKYLAQTPKETIDYAALTREIISQFSYKPDNEIIAKRLENIILARVKEIRDDLETKEVLLKGKKVGGLEFTEDQADDLLGLIRRYASQAPIKMIDTDDVLVKLPTSAASQPKIEMEDGLPVVKMPVEPINVKQSQKLSDADNIRGNNELPAGQNNVKIKPVIEKSLPAPQPQPFDTGKMIPESVLNAKTALKPNLDDVKLERKTMGPIDELENMTIIEFRRLAGDQQSAVGKLKEKINLLEKEGFNRRLEGINAWQKNEVNKFYRLLGQLSMSEGKSIEDVIKERLIGGKPTLALDEFNAVMELNRDLRY